METAVAFAVWASVNGIFQRTHTERYPGKDEKPKMEKNNNMKIAYTSN